MDRLVTVFGGSGFVGRAAVRALAKRGWRVRVAMRKPHLGYRLRPLGDVGQIEFVRANIRRRGEVLAALEGAQATVNLVGVLYERPSGQGFEALHAAAAGVIARAAAAQGIDRMVQVSALGADSESSSLYACSKARGEQAVTEALPDAVILRPSVVFGPEDDFFNRFAAMAGLAPALPLIGGGGTRFQPVYVGDVAEAIASSLEDGRGVYELGGPTTYTFRELLQIVLRETGRTNPLVPLPWWAASLIGGASDIAFKLLGFAPVLTRDQVVALRTDNVVTGDARGLEAFGIVPTSLEAVIPSYLWRYRKGGQFANLTAPSSGLS